MTNESPFATLPIATLDAVTGGLFRQIGRSLRGEPTGDDEYLSYLMGKCSDSNGGSLAAPAGQPQTQACKNLSAEVEVQQGRNQASILGDIF